MKIKAVIRFLKLSDVYFSGELFNLWYIAETKRTNQNLINESKAITLSSFWSLWHYANCTCSSCEFPLEFESVACPYFIFKSDTTK